MHIFGMILLVSFSLPFVCFGQNTEAADQQFDSSAYYSIQSYRRVIGSSAGLYSGSQFREYVIHSYDTGHPFYYSDELETGSVSYDGQHYANVDMQYDILTDRLIIENAYNHVKIVLISDKVKNFSLNNHTFVRLEPDTTLENSVRPGFYDLLYDGNVKLYARRKKDIDQRIFMGNAEKLYNGKIRYFIYKNNAYFPVHSKSSVLRVFHDRKNVLRSGFAKSHISFRKDRERSIVQLTKLYDEPAVSRN